MKKLLFLITILCLATTSFAQVKKSVFIDRFANETAYGKGFFYEPEYDILSQNAVNVLNNKLVKSGFASSTDEALKSTADYIIYGTITKFELKDYGTQKKFYNSRVHSVNVGVEIRVVGKSGKEVYSDKAEGVYEVETEELMGYDMTEQQVNLDVLCKGAFTKVLDIIYNDIVNAIE